MRTSTKRLALIAPLLAAVAASVWAGVAYTSEGSTENRSGVRAGEGVGMYSDPSSANQASTFTINRLLVSCGVGAENLAGVGRFEMLMFSTNIRQYHVDAGHKEITVRGEMRSITRVGGLTLEDVRHPFIAHALDLDGDETLPRRDRFDVHFKTPFWQPGNPMCTPSVRYPGSAGACSPETSTLHPMARTTTTEGPVSVRVSESEAAQARTHSFIR